MYLANTGYSGTKEKVIKEIIDWSLGKEKFMNLISPPYNLAELFLELILSFTKNNKKVLYITNEETSDVQLIKDIKKLSSFRQYVYFKENSDYNRALLVISKHNNLDKIKAEFDLVIYDDIKSFSFYKKENIAEVSIRKCKDNGKVLVYSIEKIFNGSREVIFPVRANHCPIVEPKFISTRIDINKDIPYVIYEYLEWSISCSGRVIVYVPDEDRVNNVYNYLSKYCSKFVKSTLYYVKNNNDKNTLYKFISAKNGIIITNHFNDIKFDLNNVNVMVFFADDKYFDYKKLVYLCGKVGRSEKNLRGEVVFLGNNETEDIDISRSITRYFNKEAWEMDLLRI